MLGGVIFQKIRIGGRVEITQNQKEVEHQNQNGGGRKDPGWNGDSWVRVCGAWTSGRIEQPEAGQGCEEAEMEHVAPLIAPKVLTTGEHGARQVG